MEIFKLFGSILIKDEEALKKLDNIDKKGAKTGASFEKMTQKIGSGMQNVGKVFAGIGTGITASMLGLVKVGSDWSAQVAGQQFLFNNLDKEIQNAINTNSKYAESLGLTSQQYKNGATDIATYYKNMGLTSDETAKLSGKTMDLVADLGAVKDVPFDEALADFKSALMGNYEAVDKYGISLSASTLENSEFVKSLGKSWNQLSDNEKMMAAYNEITRQGASAQGLAKQEAQSFGMQMKLLKQKLMEAAGSIGEKLLPVLEPLIQKTVQIVDKIATWVQKNPELTRTILIIVGAFGIFSLAIGALLIPLGGLVMAVGSFNVAMLPVYGIILAVIAAIGLLIGVGIALWANWDSLTAKASEVWNLIKTTITNLVTQCVDWIKLKWEEAKLWITTIWNNISTMASLVWNGIKNTIVQFVTGAVNTVKTLISNMKAIISAGFNTIKGITNTIWTGIKTVISTLFTGAFNHLKLTVGLIKAVFSGDLKGAISIVKGIFDNIKNTIKGVMDAAKNTVKGAIDKIKGFFNFTWSLPKLKMPHFSMSGKFSLNPPQVPHMSVEWYKNGGIMMNPTMFGFNPMSGKAMVGGEAGPEAILPLSKIPELMKEMGYIGNNQKPPVFCLNIDGREFIRAVAQYKDEFDEYDSRSPEFTY